MPAKRGTPAKKGSPAKTTAKTTKKEEAIDPKEVEVKDETIVEATDTETPKEEEKVETVDTAKEDAPEDTQEGSDDAEEGKDDEPQKEQDKSNEALKEEVQKKEKLEQQMKQTAVAQVQENKVKLVKVKFIENHVYNRGSEKINARVGDVKEVEPHLANKFVQRKLAYILG